MAFRTRTNQDQMVRDSLFVEGRQKQSYTLCTVLRPIISGHSSPSQLVWMCWYGPDMLGFGLVPFQPESPYPPLHPNMHFFMTLFFFLSPTNQLAGIRYFIMSLLFYVSMSCLLKYKSTRFRSIWSISFLSWLLTRNTIPDNDSDWHKARLITINPAQTKVSVLPLMTLLRISAFHVSLD